MINENIKERAQKIFDSLEKKYNNITIQQIEAVIEEYTNFEKIQYAGKSLKERQKLGQFFTPPELSIKMLDKITKKFPLESLFDPCAGAGGLLKAAILCNAVKEENCYGLEYDKSLIETTTKIRLPKAHIKYGNALNPKCLSKEFFDNDMLEYIDDNDIGIIKNNTIERQIKSSTGFLSSFGKIKN